MSWNFRAFLLGLGLLAMVIGFLSRSDAGGLDITWQKPETHCDGTPMSDLTGFRAYWAPHRAEIADAAASSYSVRGLPPGDWWIGITAVNSANVESPLAGPVLKTITAEDFKTSGETVYTVVKRTDSFLLLPVGTAPIGTVCNASQGVNGHYAVPRAAVTWSGLIRPDVVVARCE